MEQRLVEIEKIAIELQDDVMFLQKTLAECESQKTEYYEELQGQLQKQMETKSMVNINNHAT